MSMLAANVTYLAVRYASALATLDMRFGLSNFPSANVSTAATNMSTINGLTFAHQIIKKIFFVIVDTAQLDKKPILVSTELSVMDTAMRKTSSYDRKNSFVEKRAS